MDHGGYFYYITNKTADGAGEIGEALNMVHTL